MRTQLATVCLGFLAAACVVTMLGGCSTGAPQKAPQKPSVASHAPTATSTPKPPAPTDVLFTISAKVRSSAGATIGIQLTAHSPLAASDDKAAALASEFLNECGGVGGTPITLDSMVSNGSTLVRLDLTSTTTGQTFVSPLDLYLGSNFSAKAANGDGIVQPQASDGCLGTYSWSSSGTAHGIAEFESDSATADMGKWRYGLYGFAVQAGANATIESCTITMTDLATAAKIKDVPGWVSRDTSGTTCATGYVGE